MNSILIADSGSTKCDWCLISTGKIEKIKTEGISPYFLNIEEIVAILRQKVASKIPVDIISNVVFYGTGLSNKRNSALVKNALKQVFPHSVIECYIDMLAAARAVCGNMKGIVSILGTGSNACYYNGKEIKYILYFFVDLLTLILS